jgi:dTDP-4-dehydrorhamnose 3,5-epimerase
VRIETGPIDGLVMFEPRVHRDGRGWFRETWHAPRYAEGGLDVLFVQDNVSRSARGVLRGMHFQEPHGQGKLASVLGGEVFDVAVDIRVGSPTFGRWAGYRLSEENGRQLYLPPGLAHGFLVLSEWAVFEYKCTEVWSPESEHVLRWDDPDLGIEWPLDVAPELSARDRGGRRLRDFAPGELPSYAAPVSERDETFAERDA